MKFRSFASRVAMSIVALGASASTLAHPGHEPEDLVHAIAHALASPRGVLVLLILSAAAGLWWYVKKQKK